MAGEYTFSIFAVVTIALLVSWIVAVVFTPYLGYKILDAKKLHAKAQQHGDDLYETPFYRRMRASVEWCVRRRWLVIIATVLVFALSLVALGTGVQKQFFPASARLELLVDLWLPQGSSLKATEAQARKVEQRLLGDPAMKKSIKDFVAYIGNGSPRFYLPLDQQLFNDNFAPTGRRDQRYRRARGPEAPPRVLTSPATALTGRADWLAFARACCASKNGPPVGFPVQFRVSGENLADLRRVAEQCGDRHAHQSAR